MRSDAARPRFMQIGAIIVLAVVVGFTPIPLALLPELATEEARRPPLPEDGGLQVQSGLQSGKRKHEEETRKLHGNGGGRIPIEQAMREIVEEKIAGWPPPAGKPSVAQRQTQLANQFAPKAHAPASGPEHAASGSAAGARCRAAARSQRHCLPAKAERAASAAARARRR